jgi:hypothetical protein
MRAVSTPASATLPAAQSTSTTRAALRVLPVTKPAAASTAG